MKKVLSLFCAIFLFFSAHSQSLNFLNYSICTPPSMPAEAETNEYVQGGGHNYYLSYSIESHVGSFSEYEYPYGTEENPMIIYVDSIEGQPKKYYYKDPEEDIYTGIDEGDMYISEGLWPDYESEDDILIGPDLEYEETALRCTLNKDDYWTEDKFKPTLEELERDEREQEEYY